MRVLIAHADEASRAMLAEMVRDASPWNLDIMPVGDGREVLDLLLDDDPPEVALVDWDMPDIEGPEMCRLIRDFHYGHDTWLAVLAGPLHADTADAWRAGADDCISLPATADVLLACVAKGVEQMAPRQAHKAAELMCAFADEYEEVAEAPAAQQRPSLDAVCHPDEDISEDQAAGLSARLRAVSLEANVDPEGGDDCGPAVLSAVPELNAQRFEPCDDPNELRGHATLDAVLAQL